MPWPIWPRILGNGDGVAFLMEQSSSPSRARLQQMVGQKYPKARWFVYEAVDLDAARHAATLAYGKSVAPYYNLDKADTILALDCDFIGTEENAAVNIRRFAQGRALAGKEDAMSRLYAVESLFTLTGMNADHRLRVAPSLMMAVVARMAREILPSGDWDAKLKELSAPAQAEEEWIVPCAKDLKAGGGKSLVTAGYRLPPAAHLLVLAMNEQLGAVGSHRRVSCGSRSHGGGHCQLAEAIQRREGSNADHPGRQSGLRCAGGFELGQWAR